MYIARILYPIEVLGPGKRIGIWFCGCPHKCKGCSNPELWEFQERYKTSLNTIKELINRICVDNLVEGFTITGGDPFYQENELVELLGYLKTINEDILVYTGYKKEEISPQSLNDIAVLIDGKYIEELNFGHVLIGSDNQKVHILKSAYQKKYNDYISTTKNKIQNFTSTDGIISVGIHKPNFNNDFKKAIANKGLEEIK